MKNPFLKIVSLLVIFINSTLFFGINPLLVSENLELNSAKLFNKNEVSIEKDVEDPTFTVSVENDALDEGDAQTITVTLSNASENVSKFKIKNALSTITNDDFRVSLGGEVKFEKKWSDDPENELYQDKINQYTWLSRGTHGPLVNKSSNGLFYQSSKNPDGPTGVTFASGTYENLDQLTFLKWSNIRFRYHTNENYLMKVVSNVDADGIFSYDYLPISIWY